MYEQNLFPNKCKPLDVGREIDTFRLYEKLPCVCKYATLKVSLIAN